MHHNPISIQDLHYFYPDGTHALKGIHLDIKANERVALVGANGSGKSTLLLHLNGILLPQQGTAMVGEYPMEAKFLKQIRNFVGIVFQNPDEQIFMPTVWEDITFGPLNQGCSGDTLTRRCYHAMYAVIAGVLAMQPQVLVLDEPTSQLDPRSRRQLIHLLQGLPLTQLIATHDLDLALELCDRTIVLSEGRVARDDLTANVLSDRDFLEEHHLELPLSYQRPYCLLDHPAATERVFSPKITSRS
jgi:cobalt/nickel transport system ATP-binding protein